MSASSIPDWCLPFMVVTLGALPPVLIGGSCDKFSGGDIFVLCGVPLGGHVWEVDREAVGSRQLMTRT